MKQTIKAIYQDGRLSPVNDELLENTERTEDTVFFTIQFEAEFSAEGSEEYLKEVIESFFQQIPPPHIDESPLTDEEIAELLQPIPLTGKEIVEQDLQRSVEDRLFGAWPAQDGMKWVEQQRQNQKDQSKWSLD